MAGGIRWTCSSWSQSSTQKGMQPKRGSPATNPPHGVSVLFLFLFLVTFRHRLHSLETAPWRVVSKRPWGFHSPQRHQDTVHVDVVCQSRRFLLRRLPEPICKVLVDPDLADRYLGSLCHFKSPSHPYERNASNCTSCNIPMPLRITRKCFLYLFSHIKSETSDLAARINLSSVRSSIGLYSRFVPNSLRVCLACFSFSAILLLSSMAGSTCAYT